MRKTDKKVDNQLRVALTNVCDFALKGFSGFQWLTHIVSYSDFPKSLKIICVFDNNDSLSNFMETDGRYELGIFIQKNLFEIGINLKNMGDHISYETEENYEKSHNGNWADRLE